MQERTLLDNPIVLFQRRDESVPETEETKWITDRVFLDDDEADQWVAQQPHRYKPDSNGIDWRCYAVPAQGELATIIREARSA